jgi:hypothetical protein
MIAASFIYLFIYILLKLLRKLLATKMCVEENGPSPSIRRIKRRNWGRLGHTLRKPHVDVNRTALEWNPQGSRRRSDRVGPGGDQFTWRLKVWTGTEFGYGVWRMPCAPNRSYRKHWLTIDVTEVYLLLLQCGIVQSVPFNCDHFQVYCAAQFSSTHPLVLRSGCSRHLVAKRGETDHWILPISIFVVSQGFFNMPMALLTLRRKLFYRFYRT